MNTKIFLIIILIGLNHIDAQSKDTNNDKSFEIDGKDLAYGDRGLRPSYLPGEPQVKFDMDGDGLIESLHFYTDGNLIKFKFIKGDENGNYIEDFYKLYDEEALKEHERNQENSEDSETWDPRDGKIYVRFHDFDMDGIPEMVLESEGYSDKDSEYCEAYVYGQIYKINGVGASLKNLNGLSNWLQLAGDYNAWDYNNAQAVIENNKIYTGRQMPENYVYVDGRLVMF